MSTNGSVMMSVEAFCLLKCKVSSGKSYLCPLELSLICPPVRQFQFETTPSFNQLGWNPYDFPTDGSCHLLFLLISQSCLLEPVHEVIGQHDQLKIESGSCPAPANTLVQPKSIDAFFDEILTTGTLIIKMPDFLYSYYFFSTLNVFSIVF